MCLFIVPTAYINGWRSTKESRRGAGQGRVEPVAIYDQIMVEHLVRAAWPISQSHVAVPAPAAQGKLSKYGKSNPIKKKI